MAELYLIRHAQASFGADDYDKLSKLGQKQSYALGQALAIQGVRPDIWIRGDMRRHRETIKGIAKGMGLDTVKTEIHAGLNEYDFTGLLNARYLRNPAPENMHTDRKTHFRTLRETVLEWQADCIENPPETWVDFEQRIEGARKFIMREGANTVLALSSGGAISQMISAALETPKEIQIRLQLQMKNCAVNRFIFTRKGFYVHGFNESPHVTQETNHFLTYS
ncbi:MAG: phosphoglycerate mutase [Flammeovirgaceae bacterium TMED32]|nr:phosphoglycerate mutase [Gammaproteobacteria bacterium]OUT96556.1 MAG: phosphoglycerate mutase [Flammeovirgaceae bacterium TMED32]RPG47894.1 MAG: histidine phosphatase family protein [Gammaproteobacteria bacterium TMED182]|tara:strand:- start:1480 stop:2145 length:666 start_codon:yes stop_codon:yes gene_type:complete